MNLNIESGRVGTYQGNQVYVIEEKKFQSKKSNRNFIYALGHQGTYEKLDLIFYDGEVWRVLGTIDSDGTNLVEYKPDKRYVYREKEVKVERKRTNEEKKVEEEIDINLDKLSENIDRFLEETAKKEWGIE